MCSVESVLASLDLSVSRFFYVYYALYDDYDMSSICE